MTEAAWRLALRRGAQTGQRGERTDLRSVAAQTDTYRILNLSTDGATLRRRTMRRVLTVTDHDDDDCLMTMAEHTKTDRIPNRSSVVNAV